MLEAATKSAAAFFGQEAEFDTMEAGKRADLTLVEGTSSLLPRQRVGRVGFLGSKGEHAKTRCRRVSFTICPLVSGDWPDVQRNPPGDRLELRRRHQCFLDRAHHEHRREFAERHRPLSRLLQHVRLTVPGPQLRSDRGVDLDPASSVTESNGQLSAHGADVWLHLQRFHHRRA